MYNINMYEYKDKPYSKIKKYEILPLNQNGFEKYVGSNSHNTNYVSRINPKVFKEIVGMDYESIINSHLNSSKDRQSIKAPETDASPNKEALRKEKKEEDKVNPKTMRSSISIDKPLIKPKLKTSQSMRHISPMFCMSPTMSDRPNFYQTFHRKQTYKDKYGYPKKELTKTNEDRYSLELSHLKNIKLRNDDFNSTHSSEYYPSKRYCGFTSYRVPRIDEMTPNNLHSSAFNQMRARLERSISSGSLTKSKEFEVLKKENEEMKENLGYQTNKTFLLHAKLPSVLNIADSNKLIRRIGLGNSKDMGERYNPFSNVYNPANRTKRNYTGSLFLH